MTKDHDDARVERSGSNPIAFPFWNYDERRMRALWRIIIHGIILGLLAFPLFAVLGFIVDAVAPLPLRSGISLVATVVVTALLMATTVWIAGRLLDRRMAVDFGFRFDRRWWADMGFGLALGAGLMALIFGAEYAAGWVKVVDTLHAGRYGASFGISIMAALLVFVCVGFYEELFSRGYHLKNLAEGTAGVFGAPPALAIVIALILSSAVFGLGHAGNPNATLISTFNIMLAGVFLGVGYILTGELAISIGLHITWNFFQGCVFGFPVSGNAVGPTFLRIEQGGPDLITGGAFGPEAGVIGIVAMVVGSGLTVAWVRSSRGLDGVLAQFVVRRDAAGVPVSRD